MLALRTLRRRIVPVCCNPPTTVAENPDASGLHAHYVRRVFERCAAAGDPDLHELAFHLYTIHLNPLDPDGSAGLGKLGTMLSISMLLMGTMGVTVLVVIHPEFLSGNL